MVQSSKKNITIALDAMGGDNAPHAVLKGAERVLRERPDIDYLLFGDASTLSQELEKYPLLKKVSSISPAQTVISSDMKPSDALRKGRDSSMRLAINAVKEGKASAIVSAGNTGALMAMAKIVLKTLPGIDRPAIASVFPTRAGRCILLDLGANIECTPRNLFEFAVMGDAFAKVVLDLEKPKVGLLNVGEEEMKGHGVVKEAHALLKESSIPMDFYGFVEGTDITEGTTDVVVTDGFTGNIALKTAEGTAKICMDYIKMALTDSFFSKVGAMFALPSIKRLFKRLDPRLYNGAMFLGLNGIAVKSHGSVDDVGFGNAILVAIDLAENAINEKISEKLSASQEQTINKEDVA